MNINVDALRANMEAMLESFPSVTAEARRPAVDGYGERTGAFESLGTVTGWFVPPDPKRYRTAARGMSYDDEDAQWLTIIWEDGLPNVKRGDIARIGGEDYEIKNVKDGMYRLRVMWQLRKI